MERGGVKKNSLFRFSRDGLDLGKIFDHCGSGESSDQVLPPFRAANWLGVRVEKSTDDEGSTINHSKGLERSFHRRVVSKREERASPTAGALNKRGDVIWKRSHQDKYRVRSPGALRLARYSGW